jgi:anti-sigma factor ChrR (cupin superfamily)
MKINADFDERVVLHGAEMEWVETQMKGVKRRMLDRVGAESGRATSIVSYDPNSKFSSHVHTGGEEFIVLDGVFQDEHGDFPVGSYIRNPPESSHTPGSEEGCMIFVKLWQFDKGDRTEVKVNYDQLVSAKDADRPGVSVTPLHKDQYEEVRMEEWEADTTVLIEDKGGIEILVIDGSIEESDDQLKKLSWLRVPVGSTVKAKAGSQGARVWIKTGHLRHIERDLAAA